MTRKEQPSPREIERQIYGYARVSTREQADHGQRAQIEGYCVLKGLC